MRGQQDSTLLKRFSSAFSNSLCFHFCLLKLISHSGVETTLKEIEKMRKLRKSLKDFIEKSIEIHGSKYDYSKSIYIGNHKPIEIICPIHGSFWQQPANHYLGRGCKFCANNVKYTKDVFIQKATIVHNSKYIYNDIEYNGIFHKIGITCPKHGNFEQTPHKHLLGQGCPKCRRSIGEMEIERYLKANSIYFLSEYSFNDLVFEQKLRFDFYLPNNNICIEFQGEQHYYPVEKFGGFRSFEKQIMKDELKRKYCRENHIQLLEIKYDENIEQILRRIF